MFREKKLLKFVLVILIMLANFLPGIFNAKKAEAVTYTFTEDFTTDTYKDATTTTADWDTVGNKAEMTASGEMRLTTNSSDQTNPDIYGDYIVYEDLRNGNSDIYMYQISTGDETRITTDSNNQNNPAIWGDYIVYEDDRNGNSDIYMYQISTSTETRVTTDSSDQDQPDIWDDYIVWQDARGAHIEVYKYQISTTTESLFASESSAVYNPKIHGGYLVYRYTTTFCIDGSLIGEASTCRSENAQNPEVYYDGRDLMIVYSSDRDGNDDIYKHDGTTETLVENNINLQLYPVTNGSNVYWMDNRNTHNDIYASNSTNRVTSDSGNQQYPAVYDSYIVWQDDRNGNWDIYAEYNVAQSNEIDVSSGQILSATLTTTETTPIGTNIVYYLSNDGGTTWEEVSSGVENTFSSTGEDLRWKAIMLHSGAYSSVPYTSQISIEYTASDGRRYTPADLDTTPPATVNNISIEKFPYSVSRDLLITWQNPEEEDFNGVSVYRTKGKCPTDINQLNLNQDNLLIETTPSMQAMFDFSIEDIFSTYCYLFESKDANGNLSDVGIYEITPMTLTSWVDGATEDESSEDIKDEANETIIGMEEGIESISNELMNQVKFEMSEIKSEYKSDSHSLGLMQYTAGRFLLLVEEGLPANLYYVSAKEGLPSRYVLTWETMYDIFGKLSWGINQSNLDKIPVCNKGIGNPLGLPRTLLLNVEDGGSVWYFDGECRTSITKDNLWNVIPGLALGINLDNLSKIPLGDI